MSAKPFGRTVRQEVVNMAVTKLRVWRREGQTVKTWDAVEAVIDGGRPGTLGGAMRDYVAGVSDAAFRRLECEIDRKTRSTTQG